MALLNAPYSSGIALDSTQFPLIMGTDGTPQSQYGIPEITRANNVLQSQYVIALLALLGLNNSGVIRRAFGSSSAVNALKVSAAGGLNVSVAPGLGLAFHPTYGPMGAMLKTTTNIALDVDATTTIYLLPVVELGTDTDTRYNLLALPVKAGVAAPSAIPLATVTTNTNAITTLTDVRTFIDMRTADTISDFTTAVRSAMGAYIGAPVADVAALRAIAAADRFDKQVRFVESTRTSYSFDLEGTGADDGDLILVPASGGGRWFRDSTNAATLAGQTLSYILNRANHTGTRLPVIIGANTTASIAATTDIHQVNAAGNTTQTLPASALTNFSGEVMVKNLGAGQVSVTAAAGYIIENGDKTLNQYGALTFYLDGTVWRSKG